MRTPKFENIEKILRQEAPDRPTLFEFFLNDRLYKRLSGSETIAAWGTPDHQRAMAKAFIAAGYDYATVDGSAFRFPLKPVETKASRSMNDVTLISDRASFDAYEWPNPDDFDYSGVTSIASEMPAGSKVIVAGPGGVLENVLFLVGYETLCYILADDPRLVDDLFTAVGSRLLRYYELSVAQPGIGAIISNDDWGFKTQTMLPPKLMRQYVFPWHKRIVAVAHEAGIPAILHSCGNLASVMDDIIDDIKFDGKHSYEDTICPVEEMYEKYHGRIAIMGGIDLNFLCRSTPEQVHARSKAMLERSGERGAFGLGSGNSIPEYVPDENYFAMISAATGHVPD